MSLTKYTGKDMAATFDVASPFALNGLQTLEIVETAAPLPEQMDTTTAVASAYEFTADPLGGRGTAKTTVTAGGLMSNADYADTGYAAIALNTLDSLTIYPAGNTATYNKCVAGNCYFRGLRVTASVRDWIAFQATWEANEVPTWSATAG